MTGRAAGSRSTAGRSDCPSGTTLTNASPVARTRTTNQRRTPHDPRHRGRYPPVRCHAPSRGKTCRRIRCEAGGIWLQVTSVDVLEQDLTLRFHGRRTVGRFPGSGSLVPGGEHPPGGRPRTPDWQGCRVQGARRRGLAPRALPEQLRSRVTHAPTLDILE